MADPAWVRSDALVRLDEWGGPELARQMIELFLGSAPKKLDRIRSGLASRDLEAVERAAHSLEASAGNLGGERLRELSLEVEERAARGESQGLPELVDELEEGLERTCEALRTLSPEVDG